MAFSDSLSVRTVKLDTLHPTPLLDTMVLSTTVGKNLLLFEYPHGTEPHIRY